MRHFALPATMLALVTAACGWGGAVAEGNVKDVVAPAKSATHFAGVPPRGMHASTPTTGRLLLRFDVQSVSSPRLIWTHLIWRVYADGRVIWQKWSSLGDPVAIPAGARMIDTSYVQQQLTPQGLHLLRARIRSTGLFEHNLRLGIASHHGLRWIGGGVRRGDHMVTLSACHPAIVSCLTKATPAEERGFAQLQALLADTAAWSLPHAAWADRKVRAFRPSHYVLGYDLGPPDLTMLPAPLLPYKKLFSDGGPYTCEIVTTGELRAILQAVLAAGMPVGNHAFSIGFILKGVHGARSGPHFSPVPPSDSC